MRCNARGSARGQTSSKRRGASSGDARWRDACSRHAARRHAIARACSRVADACGALVTPRRRCSPPRRRWRAATPHRPPAPRARFPPDFGAHPEARTEWWYITGASQAGARRLGLPDHVLSRRDRHRRRRRAASRRASCCSRTPPSPTCAAPAAPRPAHRAHRLRHRRGRVGRHRRWSCATGAWRAAAAPARSRYAAPRDERARRLRASSSRSTRRSRCCCRATDGVSRKGPRPEQTSRYYSEPQLAVSGTLRSTAARPTVDRPRLARPRMERRILDAGAVGWDWIGMNLDDGSALTAFRLRRADGSALWAGGSHRPARRRDARVRRSARSCSRPAASGRARRRGALSGRMAASRRRSGRFGVRALLDDQELDSRGSTGAIYWEGLALLDDAGPPRRPRLPRDDRLRRRKLVL